MRVKSSIRTYLLCAVAISSQLENTHAQSSTIDLYEYGAGTTTLKNDYGVYYGSIVPSNITIQGVKDGNTVINGGENHGYQFLSTTGATTITVKDIAAFINFQDSVDNNNKTLEGGAVFYIAGGAHLVFEGYDKDNRLLFEGDKFC